MEVVKVGVPGATLYCERRGQGPLLLLVPGGSGDAGGFAMVADALAGDFTVVSYDRRGFGRSRLAAPPDDGVRLAADVGDARGLLEHFGGGRGLVMGSSSGAIVGLELLARHPEAVERLVAHEPPLVGLLPDGADQLAFFDRVFATFERDGVDAALQQFNQHIGAEPMPVPPPGAKLPPHVAELIDRLKANLAFFMVHELRQYPATAPDLAALAAAGAKLVLAGGAAGRQHVPYRPNLVLAERLGTEVVDFPGDHIGYVQHPAEFAARLTEVIRAA
jgi:pimeloyl-ACP methyl ester carboxylesterase